VIGKRKAREEIANLAEQLREARRRRKVALREAKERCRAERIAARERARSIKDAFSARAELEAEKKYEADLCRIERADRRRRNEAPRVTRIERQAESARLELA